MNMEPAADAGPRAQFYQAHGDRAPADDILDGPGVYLFNNAVVADRAPAIEKGPVVEKGPAVGGDPNNQHSNVKYPDNEYPDESYDAKIEAAENRVRHLGILPHCPIDLKNAAMRVNPHEMRESAPEEFWRMLVRTIENTLTNLNEQERELVIHILGSHDSETRRVLVGITAIEHQ